MDSINRRLWSACKNGDMPLVTSVIKQGGDPNYSSCVTSGVNCLMVAVQGNYDDLVEMLMMNLDLDLNMVDNKGNTALHHAVRSNNMNALRLLANDYRVDLNTRDDEGKTCIMLAVSLGKVELLEMLNGVSGIDMSVVDSSGKGLTETARHCSVWSKAHLKILYILSPQEKRTETKNAPLNTVIKKKIAAKNQSHGNKTMDSINRQLWFGCKNGDMELVFSKIEQGGDANYSSGLTWGVTCLMVAVQEGHNNVVEILIEMPDVDPNKVDDTRNTALHYAVRSNNISSLELLVGCNRVDLDIRDGEDKTCLMLAVCLGKADSVLMLMGEPRVDKNVVDTSGRGLIEIARHCSTWSQSHSKVVRILSLKETKTKMKSTSDKNLSENISNKEITKKVTISEGTSNVTSTTSEKSGDKVCSPATSHKAPECPVCLEEMTPPTRIYQCGSGHLVCCVCRPSISICTICRGSITGRAVGLEQFISDIFNNV